MHLLVDQHLSQLHFHVGVAVAEHIHQERFLTQRRFHLVNLLGHHLQPLSAGTVGAHTACLA